MTERSAVRLALALGSLALLSACSMDPGGFLACKMAPSHSVDVTINQQTGQIVGVNDPCPPSALVAARTAPPRPHSPTPVQLDAYNNVVPCSVEQGSLYPVDGERFVGPGNRLMHTCWSSQPGPSAGVPQPGQFYQGPAGQRGGASAPVLLGQPGYDQFGNPVVPVQQLAPGFNRQGRPMTLQGY